MLCRHCLVLDTLNGEVVEYLLQIFGGFSILVWLFIMVIAVFFPI